MVRLWQWTVRGLRRILEVRGITATGLATLTCWMAAGLALSSPAASAATVVASPGDVAPPAHQLDRSAAGPLGPLNLSNFVITTPDGNATAYSGSVTRAFGGIHTWEFLTQGYELGFADGIAALQPGPYSTSTGAGIFLANDPNCLQGSAHGAFQIDQAEYDSSWTLTTAAIRFDFACPDGTNVKGSIAFEIQNTTPNLGYYVYDRTGDMNGFGNDSYLAYLGSPAMLNLNAAIVDMVATPDGFGYWMLSADGGVFSYGDAAFYGSMGGHLLNAPVVGVAPTADGKGYWIVASDGGIFSFGDATFFGSRGGQPLNRPIVGMAANPAGSGYWLVASDGGIFTYGGAPFLGSTGSIHLNQPVVGMTAGPDGNGYLFVAADGGIFAYGDSQFFGSAGGRTLARPIVGMLCTQDGQGYWLVAGDGGVFTYGNATFDGGLGGTGASQIVGMAR
jgi:hypothetical protein